MDVSRKLKIMTARCGLGSVVAFYPPLETGSRASGHEQAALKWKYHRSHSGLGQFCLLLFFPTPKLVSHVTHMGKSEGLGCLPGSTLLLLSWSFFPVVVWLGYVWPLWQRAIGCGRLLLRVEPRKRQIKAIASESRAKAQSLCWRVPLLVSTSGQPPFASMWMSFPM